MKGLVSTIDIRPQIASIAGFVGVGLDVKEINNTIGDWRLTWLELLFAILALSFALVVTKLMLKLNKYDRAKPKLSTSLVAFPMSGARIIRVTPDNPTPYLTESGYAKIAV